MIGVRRTFASIVAVSGASVSARVAFGQSVEAVVVAISANHDLLGGTLVGGDLRLTYPTTPSNAFVRFGAERAGGSARRTGIPCGGGPLPPGTCGPERLRDDARLTGGVGDLGMRLVNRRAVELDLILEVPIEVVHVTTHGLETGAKLDGGQALWGGTVGLSATWSPWSRFPIALEAGAAFGGFTPIVSEQILDGYTPFEQGFGVSKFQIGVAWKPRARVS